VADTYFFLWEFAVSLSVIAVVCVLIGADLLRKRMMKGSSRPELAAEKVNIRALLILGGFFLAEGIGWLIYTATHEIFVSPALKGWHQWLPGLGIALVGLFLLYAGSSRKSALTGFGRKNA
jgi:hypothetical protein